MNSKLRIPLCWKASTVAANVVDAIQRSRPYVFTDDHSTAEVETRLRSILAARADVVGTQPQADA